MKLIHAIKRLNLVFGLILTFTMQMHSMQTSLKELSDPVKPNTTGFSKKELTANLNELNQVIARNPHSDELNQVIARNPHSGEKYKKLVADINKNSIAADSINAWKINRLSQHTQKYRNYKSHTLNSIIIAAQTSQYFRGPIEYSDIEDWKTAQQNNMNQKYLVYCINQFFCKGCPDSETTKLTQYIIRLAENPSTINIDQDAIKKNIETITNNAHFQEVCQFIVDGSHFEKKSDFITALNKLSKKQYKGPRSSFFSNPTILAGSFFLLCCFVYLWKNNPDFFNRTVFPSVTV